MFSVGSAVRIAILLVFLPSLAAAEVDFARDIAPLLEQRCVRCHNEETRKGGLSLTARETALKGGESGAALEPGKPAGSLLIDMIGGDKPLMPAQGEKLTPEQVKLFEAWIAAGANWTADRKLVERAPQRLDWWSLQPIARPALPVVKDQMWPRNGIDHFILAALEKKGLSPSPAADRRVLLRRLSLDAWGLPPSPEEVRAFQASADPLAYEQLVDHRLTSLLFGQRYARHWLDVVRFAETHGFEMNNERPNSWPYRDYVIAAFQHDKPYDQFLREQIAGDALGTDIATGFLVAGAWDQVRSPDPVLSANQRADELHDIVSATSATFLGLTVGCARCHDHKFDPVPQTDYYGLKAIFEGVQHG
jgi:mono/diheme cytochrome c family protein